MKYNILTTFMTLAVLLLEFPSWGASSNDLTKKIVPPKIEALSKSSTFLSRNLENIEPLSSNTESLSSKLKNLSSNLNSKFDIDEVPKGWKLVDSSKNQDVSLKKTRKGIAILGDHYSFYTNVPNLKNFDKTPFVFSVDVRSTTPGTYIQYYDGKNFVNSARYTSKKNEWQTLNVEFTVNTKARFHRLYAAILGSVKGKDKHSVEIANIKLQPK